MAQSTTEQQREAAAPVGAPGGGASPPRRRLWVFRAVSATVIPAAFFLLLELGLRLAGVGHDTSFFVPLGGTGELTGNQKFAWQYFPPTGTRAPVMVRFPARKPEGAYRILVLGSSVAMGSPEPAFGFGRVLEQMLRQRYPGVRFEVINAAMEAMNSNVVRAVAEECSGLEGDLYLVYTGNNEVVGPYGLSDSFSGYTPSLAMIRAGMWVKSTRTGQVVNEAVNHARSGGQTPIWRGIEAFASNYVPLGDERLERTYRNFAANLEDICDSARGSGAGVLLCTLAVNLRDCAPVAPRHREGLSPAERRLWMELFDAGRAMHMAGRRQEAAEKYMAAAAVDDRRADLHYMLGRCLAEMGRFAEAKTHLVLARDQDTLRYRADSGINRTIREVGARLAGRGVRLVDVEAALEASPRSEGGLIGAELFLEHCHLTYEGNWEVAAKVFGHVDAVLPAWVRQKAAGPAAALDANACAERLAFTGWERYRLAATVARLTSRPPFTGQIDHAEQQAARWAAVEKLRPHTLPDRRDATLAAHRAAMERSPGDAMMRANYAICLSSFGDPAGAADVWRGLVKEFPIQAEFKRALGLCLIQQGRYADAVAELTRALAIVPQDLHARNNLGAALLWLGRRDEAEKCFRAVLAASPEHADAHVNLASVLAEQGRTADAMAELREALHADSTHPEARRNLARMLVRDSKPGEAVEHLRAVIALREDSLSHLDLAGLLMHDNKPEQALTHYRRAVELSPGEALPYREYGAALLRLGQFAEAAEALRKAVELGDSTGLSNRELGTALQRLGKHAEAAAEYARALERLGEDPETLHRMGYVLTAMRRCGEAIEAYRRALRADSARPETHNNLAALLAQLGQVDEAIEHFAAAVKQEPTASRHYNLAALLARRARDREAIVQYRQAMQLRPVWPEAMEGLSWVLATSSDERLRNAAEAVSLARRACELTSLKRAESVDSLAAALAEAGQFVGAVKAAEEARSLATKSGSADLAKKIDKRLELYKAGKPCRRMAEER